jgi:hypothetical protein
VFSDTGILFCVALSSSHNFIGSFQRSHGLLLRFCTNGWLVIELGDCGHGSQSVHLDVECLGGWCREWKTFASVVRQTADALVAFTSLEVAYFFKQGMAAIFFGFGVVSCKVGESCRPRADSNREDGVGHFSSCNHVPNVPSCLLNTSLSL